MADPISRELLAHDYVMQLLNAMLQRPNILRELRDRYRISEHDGQLKLMRAMVDEALASGFSYADDFLVHCRKPIPATVDRPLKAAAIPKAKVPAGPKTTRRASEPAKVAKGQPRGRKRQDNPARKTR